MITTKYVGSSNFSNFQGPNDAGSRFTCYLLPDLLPIICLIKQGLSYSR